MSRHTCEWCQEVVDDNDHDTFACAAVLRRQRDEARAGAADFKAFVNDLLIVWQGYAEDQFKTADWMKRLILAERAQCALDVRMALERPQTIEWPDGHPRKGTPLPSPPSLVTTAVGKESLRCV